MAERTVEESMPKTPKSIVASVAALLSATVLHAQDVTHPGNVDIVGDLNVSGKTFLFDTTEAGLLNVGEVNAESLDVSIAASIVGNACIGDACGPGTASAPYPLEVWTTGDAGISLVGDASGPTYGWNIEALYSPPVGRLTISTGGSPFFTIEDSALPVRLGFSGVGINNSLPQTELHISDTDTPIVRLEQTSGSGFDPQVWDVGGNNVNFFINNVTDGEMPFRVLSSATANTLVVEDSRVSIGNSGDPAEAGLHIVGNRGLLVEDTSLPPSIAPSFVHFRSGNYAQLLIETLSTTTEPRSALRLVNNGRPEIVMANSDTNGEWSFGAGTNFVLKQGAIGSDSSVKTRHLILYGNSGDLEISGQIITGGPTCSGGCDAVFSDDYDLLSIAEHAEKMFALGHLPNVGPTEPGSAVNITEQFGRLLNELEHAHIYIAELEERDRRQQNEIEAMNARHSAEISEIKARLNQLSELIHSRN
ncbi:hypothetical protein [Marimonas arenosa]|uniref:Uncharacterized protein n=1 Tax=Marimonas arenosa TaxID=1795305 RepID=A0AAE3WAY5_9RHOB|nr:hypothetical protein [Marimonas arenosa]MDQ2089294.1 hypothetical protein [Marimonas arenosa]